MVGNIESKNNPPDSKGGSFDFFSNLKDFLTEKFKSFKQTLIDLNILKGEITSSSSNSSDSSQYSPEVSTSSETVGESVEYNHMSLKEKLTQICVRSRTYGVVNKDDGGSVSFGKLQFHGAKAEKILNAIKRKNPSRYASVMTDSLFSNVKTACDSVWNDRQVKQFQSLMQDSGARYEMDKVVDETIQSYLDLIKGWGVKDPRATLAFGRICNYGPGFAEKIKNKMVGDGANINDYNQVINYYENNTSGRVRTKFQKPDPALGNKNIRQVIGEYSV